MSESREHSRQDASSPQPPVSVARRRLIGTTVGVFGAGYVGAIGYPVFCYLHTPVERAALAAKVTEVSPQGAQRSQAGPGAGVHVWHPARHADSSCGWHVDRV